MQNNHVTVIVTGGSDGYGKGIAKILKTAGADVWITGRNEKKLVECASALGVNYFVADVTSGNDWDRLFQTVKYPDVLINNAGAGGKIVPGAMAICLTSCGSK